MIVNNFFQIFIGILSVVILVGCSAFPDDRVLDVVTSSSDSSNVQDVYLKSINFRKNRLRFLCYILQY